MLFRSKYDTARAKWGGSWRLPSQAEIQELIDKCKWTWSDGGYHVKGPNGKSIFLPAAGLAINNVSLEAEGEYGNYWTSTPDNESTVFAFNLDIYDKGYVVKQNSRSNGCSIRPVSD